MDRLRILLLAPECNPESLTNPSIGYFHAQALARRHEVTLVLYASNEDAVRRTGTSFHCIEPVRLPVLDRTYNWLLKHVFQYDYGRQTLTAASYPRHIAFEREAYRQLRTRIRSGAFDVALRILPYNRVFPSPFARLLRHGPIPFVVGPISGGLPWAAGFRQLERQRRQAGYGVSRLRAVADYLPYARSTYRYARAIIAGSSHTMQMLSEYGDKTFFMPTEIGIHPGTLFEEGTHARGREELKLIFVGRLIPLKACDMALRAAAPLLRTGAARFTVVGDGPERDRLEQDTKDLGIDHSVTFAGWLPHEKTLAALRAADVLVFPSLREIGGGVVFEALALGTVPVVANFGGPGDVVDASVGYPIQMSSEAEMTRDIQAALETLSADRTHLEMLRASGKAYARERLSYDARAGAITDVLLWATGRGAKPDMHPPTHTDASSMPE